MKSGKFSEVLRCFQPLLQELPLWLNHVHLPSIVIIQILAPSSTKVKITSYSIKVRDCNYKVRSMPECRTEGWWWDMSCAGGHATWACAAACCLPAVGQSLHDLAALPLPTTFPAQAESVSGVADTGTLCCTWLPHPLSPLLPWSHLNL